MATQPESTHEDEEKSLPELKEAGARTGEVDAATGEVGVRRAGVPKWLQKLQYLEIWLDQKMGIETQGADRLPDEERRPPPLINCFLIWFSFSIHGPLMLLGFIGPELGLSLHMTVGAAILGIFVGAPFSAFNATMGPKLGLRMIAASRYSFGMWGSYFCSVLNVITIGGFLVTGLVSVGSILSAASNYSMTVIVGIVIVSILAYIISVFGYRVVLIFEKYCWILAFPLLCVLCGQAATKADASAPSQGASSLAIAGTFLSVTAVSMSNAIGWSGIAADYFVNYPSSTPRWKVWALVYSGLAISTVFPTVVGAVVGNATFSSPELIHNYELHGFGGAIRELYYPLGWSRTACVLLSFTVLGNAVPICYSAGISLQLLGGDWFRAIPRFLWSLAFLLVVAVISIAGREHLSAIILSIVSIIGYWSASFAIIILMEDQIFRRRQGYDVEVWNTTRKLPWGAAAVFSLITGYCTGGVPGMAQTYYVGAIAKKFGPYGGDVGLYMVAVITALVYLVTRPLERHLTGR